MEKAQKQALKSLLHDQLEMVQKTISKIMYNRKKMGDKKYYDLIDKWADRETELRHEISELNKNASIIEMKNENRSGFDAMGFKVPSNRMQKGYDQIKRISNFNSETCWSITNRFANIIENDQCVYIAGNPSNTDDLLKKIDLTGRYVILAAMLSD